MPKQRNPKPKKKGGNSFLYSKAGIIFSWCLYIVIYKYKNVCIYRCGFVFLFRLKNVFGKSTVVKCRVIKYVSAGKLYINGMFAVKIAKRHPRIGKTEITIISLV